MNKRVVEMWNIWMIKKNKIIKRILGLSREIVRFIINIKVHMQNEVFY